MTSPDPAILKALNLDPKTTKIASHGGSGFSSTFKLSSTGEDRKGKMYFVKTGKEEGHQVMFAGEYSSLNAIYNTVPSLCPKSYAHGQLSSTNGSFLVTDFLTLSHSKSSNLGSGISLAEKLAKLHSKAAPIPPGHTCPMFGFPVPTCCGSTQQDNTHKSTWSEFYSENRLLNILHCCEKSNGPDPQLENLIIQTTTTVVPRLLSNGHLKSAKTGKDIEPVLVHGDLWSGNHGRGSINGEGIEEMVFDASSAYAHSEFEFGIMRMFGGFGKMFEEEYYGVKGGKDEPVEEWEDRVRLYELYHHLNHYSMFGGGYRDGAVRIMKELIGEYGGGNEGYT